MIIFATKRNVFSIGELSLFILSGKVELVTSEF